MHTLNRGLVEQHVAVYGRRDAHWMASLESRVTGRVDDPDLDCWTRTAMPQYSSVHNSNAQGEKRDDPRSSPIFKWRTELDLHRPRPHSSALVTIRSWKGSILDETKIIVPTRKRSYIYTYRSLKSYSRNVAHLHWIQSSILLRQQNCIKFPRDYFRIICCDLGEGFPKKKMKRGERIGYDKSVNLIRGTRSWGDWRVLVVGARRVWTELERVHAPRRRERGETRARDAGRVWPSVDMVCLHSATMRRSSVFHGNYRRAWSSMPFVHRLISLSRSTYSRPLPLPTCLRSLERNTNRGGKREKNDLSIQSSFVNNSFNFRLDKNT